MNYKNYSADDFACDESFVRHFLRENNEDIIFWENWINEHPDKRPEFEAATRMLNLLTLGLPHSEFEVELKKMKDHVYRHSSEKASHMRISLNTKPTKKDGRWSILRIAAALILFISVGSIIFIQTKPSGDVIRDVEINEFIVKSNSNGHKSQLQLSDGSIINLNSNSEVKFLENFSKDKREVMLKGEAFFEVTHDPKRPFFVKTDDVIIKALGTSFNVRAYGDAESLKIALVTGKVEVNFSEIKSENKSILTPGEGLIFDKRTHRVTREKFDPDWTLAWRNGILYFKNASWRQIETTLQRWYNVQLKVRNAPLSESAYTGQFDNQSLELVLESLSFSKDFKYEIKGKNVEINF